MKIFLKTILKWVFVFSLFILIFGVICFYWIENANKKNIYSMLNNLPSCKTGLILGTSRYLASGTQNLYFTYRIQAAVQLLKAGKIRKLILSGDNRVNDYNEPKEMKKALITEGIPDSCLIMDYAGLRTFDSMIRCKEIFGQDSVIVISQYFHNARALFIADKIGLKAFGFNAAEVINQKTWRIKLREFFSRIRCVFDLYVFNTRPKHLGEKIIIK